MCTYLLRLARGPVATNIFFEFEDLSAELVECLHLRLELRSQLEKVSEYDEFTVMGGELRAWSANFVGRKDDGGAYLDEMVSVVRSGPVQSLDLKT